MSTWINHIDLSGGTLSLTCSENDTGQDRRAVITISGTDIYGYPIERRAMITQCFTGGVVKIGWITGETVSGEEVIISNTSNTTGSGRCAYVIVSGVDAVGYPLRAVGSYCQLAGDVVIEPIGDERGSLYVCGKAVDVDIDTWLLLTAEVGDSTEPSAVKNEYTKTVSLPGTQRNNAIFGGINRWEALTTNGGEIEAGTGFNAQKRLPIEVRSAGTLLFTGYATLDSVSIKSGYPTYNLTIYGGLGQFFYSLAYDDDGEERTLSDCEFALGLAGGEVINADYLKANWAKSLNGENPPIAFVPCHEGAREGFDADKILIAKGYEGAIPATYTDSDGKEWTNRDGYLYGECERSYTPIEMRDMRSYLCRPAVHVPEFINGLIGLAPDWEVILDPDFFASSNPYYNDAYIALPRLGENNDDDDIQAADPSTMGGGTYHPAYADGNYQTRNIPAMSQSFIGSFTTENAGTNNYVTITANVEITADVAKQIYSNLRVGAGSTTSGNRHFGISLVAVSGGKIIGVSDRFILRDWKDTREISDNNHTVTVTDGGKSLTHSVSDGYNADGLFYYKNSREPLYWIATDNGKVNNSTNKIAPQKWTMQIPKVSLYEADRDIRLYTVLQWDGKVQTKNGAYTNALKMWYGSGNNVHVAQSDISVILSDITAIEYESATVGSGSTITQELLFRGVEGTPLDWLLSYCKAFNLRFFVDKTGRKVHILKRENYYTGAITDITDEVDSAGEVTITPCAVTSRQYVLGWEQPETDFATDYETNYEVPYGEKDYNTGAEVDDDPVEVLEDSQLKGVVCGNMTGGGYKTFTNSNGKEFPSAIAEGVTVNYYNGDDSTSQDYDLFNVATVEARTECVLPCATEADDGEAKEVDITGALLFNTHTSAGTIYVTDDVEAMTGIFGDAPCYLWKPGGGDVTMPLFSREYKGVSFEFHKPVAVYHSGTFDVTTLYDEYWNKFVKEWCGANARVVELQVYLRPHLRVQDLLRSFYRWGSELWVLKKINDYNILEGGLTTCEFVRVRDVEAYKV